MSDLNTLISGLSTSDGPPTAATPPSQTAPSSSPAGRPSTQSPTDNDSAVEANHETPEHRAPPPSVSPVAPATDGRPLVAAVTGDAPARSAPEPPNEVYTEVVKHLSATSYHGHSAVYTYVDDVGEQVKVDGWRKYWERHTGGEVPRLCPGAFPDGNMKLFRHKMPEDRRNIVGAHVKLRDDRGKITYAVIPACKTCNFSGNEHPLLYECEAVSLFDRNKFEFVGQIKLMKPNGKVDAGRYWTEIKSISRRETGGATERLGKSASLTLRGYTNMSKFVEQECTYNDPDDFLLFLSVFMLDNLTGTDKSMKQSKKNKNFTPEVIMCNRGKHGMERQEEPKDLKDIKQELKDLGVDWVPKRYKRDILSERLQAAKAAAAARDAETDLAVPHMPDSISASLDALLNKPWNDVLAENPKFKQATENWGPPPRPKARDRLGARGARRAAEFRGSAARRAPRGALRTPPAGPPRARRLPGPPRPAGRVPRRPVARGRPPRHLLSNRPHPGAAAHPVVPCRPAGRGQLQKCLEARVEAVPVVPPRGLHQPRQVRGVVSPRARRARQTRCGILPEQRVSVFRPPRREINPVQLE